MIVDGTMRCSSCIKVVGVSRLKGLCRAKRGDLAHSLASCADVLTYYAGLRFLYRRGRLRAIGGDRFCVPLSSPPCLFIALIGTHACAASSLPCRFGRMARLGTRPEINCLRSRRTRITDPSGISRVVRPVMRESGLTHRSLSSSIRAHAAWGRRGL